MTGCMVLVSGIVFADNSKAFIVQGESLLYYDGGLEIRKVVNVEKGNGMLFVGVSASVATPIVGYATGIAAYASITAAGAACFDFACK